MPTPDPIAGYTPGGRFDHAFSLERIGNRKYQGHIFLDWPVDENYYGRGVCRWELAAAGIKITRLDRMIQLADLTGLEVRSRSANRSFCRQQMRDSFDKICLTPLDPNLIQNLEPVSYVVVMSAEGRAP